jgi:hypothetical protein
LRKYCCDAFRDFALFKCDKHADPYECNETPIVYDKDRRQYGLIIYDLGSPTYSYWLINSCPWCGAALYKKPRPVRRLLDFGALDAAEPSESEPDD